MYLSSHDAQFSHWVGGSVDLLWQASFLWVFA